MDRLRLADLCASTSLFTDLGTRQPVEHGLRTCLVAMRLADALGVDVAEAREVFYVSLLRFLGCTADTHQVSEIAGGNDMRFLADMAPVTMGSLFEEMSRLASVVGNGEPWSRRVRLLAAAMADPAGKQRLLDAHCEVGSQLAETMGLPRGVSDALAVGYARWDGGGAPRGVGGNAIPVSTRVAIVARDVELWGREAGSPATIEMLRKRSERAYDPEVVEAAVDIGIEDLRRFEGDLWDVVLSLEPLPRAAVDGPGVRRALIALADFADLKQPRFSGHSRRVQAIASSAAQVGDLEEEEAEILAWAALVHDLGVVAVPIGVLSNQASLGPAREEAFRMHPLWTQRLLGRCAGLERVATVAGRHHELLDGSGYPAGIMGDSGRAAGLLACAELFDESTTPLLETAGRKQAEVADEMMRLAGTGALNPSDAKAVLEVAGIGAPVVEIDRPAGLTEREIDVLRLLAVGRTNREIGAVLGISRKTVGSHVEHIYAKAGVRSRAAATLFAARNRLLA